MNKNTNLQNHSVTIAYQQKQLSKTKKIVKVCITEALFTLTTLATNSAIGEKSKYEVIDKVTIPGGRQWFASIRYEI